jgi:hypothetical protein
MSKLSNRMIQDMKLAGLVEGTQREYLRAVRQLVPRLAKTDELVLQGTYHGSDVYDGCHSIFDNFIGADINGVRGTRAPDTASPT